MRVKTAGLFMTALCLIGQNGGAQSPQRIIRFAATAAFAPILMYPQGAAQPSQGIVGDWNGTLDVQGTKLRLVLHVKKNADGKLTATIDSLDQNANGIPVSAIEQTGNNVKLELSSIAAAYQGKLNPAGNEMVGEWKQGGALPLTFRRAGGKTADEKPKGLPSTLAGFEDEANFLLMINEERVGSMG
ncbi:MAG: hypothetical protein LAO78_06265 [Acidobacteriia bacterium]|nr:hypothetical protein [Terriglobia bacterium]